MKKKERERERRIVPAQAANGKTKRPLNKREKPSVIYSSHYTYIYIYIIQVKEHSSQREPLDHRYIHRINIPSIYTRLAYFGATQTAVKR